VKLSRRGEYALRSLINLGLAREAGKSLVQVSELAEHEQLPIKFLEQIMQDLKQGGLVSSERGKFGGYRLGKRSNEITIGAVVRQIDGPLAPIGCVSQSKYEKCTCPDEAHCGLRMLMLDVRNAIAGILDRYTLADVVEITLRKLRRDNLPLPFTPEAEAIVSPRLPARVARRLAEKSGAARTSDAEGIIHHLLGDYTI
jgi:Rrf2 family protein